MSDDNQVGWTDEQWNRVRKTVADEAQKARVAAQFLPLYGPLDPTLVAVPNLRLGYGTPERQRIEVDTNPGTFLTTISVLVQLRTSDVADPELASALVGFRRAANVIARIEDALVFNGQAGPDQNPSGLGTLQPIYTLTGGAQEDGLVTNNTSPPPSRVDAPIPDPVNGGNLVAAISTAIGRLEAAGQQGPYACVLSQDLFTVAHTPNDNLVLPRDRILPFLGNGPLLRSSTITAANTGVLVALGGEPVEMVVGSDISVTFLQVTTEPRTVFRVSEKVALRVKDWNAVALLHPAPAAAARR
jgi:uncharacterized linocin/CFP29 family protein